MKGLSKPLAGGLIAVALILLIFFAVPGLAASILDPQQPCEDAPFSSECLCAADENRIQTPEAIARYFCEKVDLFLDPESPSFTEDAVAYAEQQLSEQFPQCDMATCNQGDAQWFISTVPGTILGSELDRVVILECKDAVRGRQYSQLHFDLETGAIESAGCQSFEDGNNENPSTTSDPASLSVTGPNSNWPETGDAQWRLEFTAHCGPFDNGIAFASLEAPQGTSLSNWRLSSNIPIATSICSIQDPASSHASVKCDAQCGSAGVVGLFFWVNADVQ